MSQEEAPIHSWIDSLSYDAFLNALAYTFQSTEKKIYAQDGEGRRHRYGGERGLAAATSERNAEFELLQKMLLHKRHMFRFRDGQDSGTENDNRLNNIGSLRGQPKHSHAQHEQFISNELPSELSSVLAAAGVHRSLDELVDVYNREDSDEEQLFDARTVDASNGLYTSSFRGEPEMHLYDDDEGESDAELKLLQWATLMPANIKDAHENQDGWCLKLFPDMKCLSGIEQNRNENSTKENLMKNQLLDILRIASCGKFLTLPPIDGNDAAWFDPQQWFSLACFVVSRLEIGLWAEFNRTKASGNSKVIANESYDVPIIIERISALDMKGTERVWSCAVAMVLQNEFGEVKNLLDTFDKDSNTVTFGALRESLIMQLLELQLSTCSSTFNNERLTYTISVPLQQWSTPQSQMKLLVHEFLEESYSREIQRALLLELNESPEGLGGGKKKKKRKKRKQKLSSTGSNIVDTSIQTSDSTSLPDNIVHEADQEQDSINGFDDNNIHVESIIHACHAQATACSSPKQIIHTHNDAKIFVLAIIDEVLLSVFEKVDLNNAEYETSDSSVRASSADAAMEFLNRDDNRQLESCADTRPLQAPPITLPDEDELFPQFQPSKEEISIFDGTPLCLSGALDGYNSVARPLQEQDILLNLLEPNQHISAEPNSTAASVASSEGNFNLGIQITAYHEFESLDESNKAAHATVSSNVSERLSETPPPPPTPPPQLSPILVSLADLGKLRKEAAPIEPKITPDEISKVDYQESKQLSSPPKSPLKLSSVISLSDAAPLTRNFSRDDLRSIDERRRPHRRDKDISMGRPQLESFNRNVDALLSYRNVVAQSVHRKHSHDGNKPKTREDLHPLATRNAKTTTTPRSNAWMPADFSHPKSSITSAPSFKEPSPIINKILHLDVAYARSECFAIDGAEDVSHCNVIPRAHTDEITKDGATTISSVHSPPVEEQYATVKEERDSYRDHCLMLGAENAKLRNLLASKMCAPFQTHSPFPEQMNPYLYQNPPFPFQFGPTVMSDAGIHRGDNESSIRSEDGTDLHQSVIGMSVAQTSMNWQARGDSVKSVGRRTSAEGTTYAESDTSLEQNVGGAESHTFSAFRQVNQQDSFFGPMGIPIHGMRSRLSQDIDRFMHALKSQLQRNEGRRMLVTEQITKAVNAVWPRAQIKMYGSHMTRLCLPSSDMDFVICLPAVHKNAPAQAPGDLEGRNAINETNQKVLARKLKGESWLDQRSLKVIERTAVPVIKVSTKDSRSRVVQLDLSFDAKEHHGLEALSMIRQTLDELPVIRPLVLVLKQFLLDRGLLTAYTGGLSSYCLFLMVARYCQEQSPTWCDCGSLLMGLLDFYGNFFDPRTTGISVGKRQYFSRSQVVQQTPPLSTQFFNEEQVWNMPPHQQFNELSRRNSFSDRSFGSGGKPAVALSSRFQMLNRQFSLQGPFHAHASHSNVSLPHQPKSYQSGKPYTYDPIWVEDPLNPGNNVGRNAFRIFQVQRAFSDAHRALVAALEWDINSVHEFEDDGEYPLLKCLLQNEDVFFDIMRD